MEDLNQQQEKKKFFEFADAIEQRVNDIGAQKGATARVADTVIERLYRSSGGDVTKVADDQIVEMFDVVNQKGD